MLISDLISVLIRAERAFGNIEVRGVYDGAHGGTDLTEKDIVRLDGKLCIWADGENYVGGDPVPPPPDPTLCRICRKEKCAPGFDHCGAPDCLPF